MNILLFLAVLVALIVVHEWGHFLAAKMFGIKVEEFGIGYPPRAWRIGKMGETVYTINWIPFGGFVKIFGQELGEDVPKSEEKRALVTQSAWKQAIVFVAGVVFNWIFAFILFAATFMMGAPFAIDEKSVTNPEEAILAISNVFPGSPAEVAGLKAGDTLVALVSDKETIQSPLPSEVTAFIKNNGGEPIQVFYKRGQGEVSQAGNVSLVPTHGIMEGKQGTPAIGIGMTLIASEKQGVVSSIILGAKKTYYTTIAIAVGTGRFIKDAVTGNADWQTVAGPVGIVGLVGDASSLGIIHLMTFTAMISVNLAIINLIPIPALDGGRLLFVIIEGVTRRKIPSSIAGVLNMIGFAAIILLMIVITYHDITKIVS